MFSHKTYHAHTVEELRTVATQMLKYIEHPLILLKGDLGAGKTTLIKQFLNELGSEDKGSSPSYALINEYSSPQERVYHIDLYRLTSVEEAFALGIEEILYSGNYCFVEWPQLIETYIEGPYHVISIAIGENKERKITLV